MIELLVNDGSTDEDIIALLAKGNIDIKTFNKKGLKTFDSLVKEVRDKDVILYWDSEARRIVRFAQSMKLLIITTAPLGCLLETRRVYVKNDGKRKRYFPVETDECFSMSETRQREEGDFEAVQRGLLQEFGIPVDMRELRPLSVGDDQPPARKSRVYYGVWSQTVIRRFIWTTDKEFPKKLKPIKDNNVNVYVEWHEGLPRKVRDWVGILEASDELILQLAARK